jgi:UDP-N-acetylglucosamine--N-acetylmuramyl-(pentapeptide) pyrophosphoryl-undecaprenol N-acetylglucosamine transferase
MVNPPIKLLIAASGTGGHLFPAIALAEKLSEYNIEWLGVSNRLETQLVPGTYPLNTVAVAGFQQGFSLSSIRVLWKLMTGILKVRRILKQGKFHGVFTTGGYIAGPAVIAARLLGLPVVFHESNAIPGKVTRFFGPWCNAVAIGFDVTAQYLPRSQTVCVGTPVRSLDLPIPDNIPLIVVFGGSQGAVAVNKLVRQSADALFQAGAYIVHLTGENDPDINSIQHPQYIALPFYDNMAALLRRANLVISRSGAGSLTELAVCGKPAILIPYPFAAEDHQSYNAKVFTQVGAALSFKQSDLTPEILTTQILNLLQSPAELAIMAEKAKTLAVPDSADKLATLVREVMGD